MASTVNEILLLSNKQAISHFTKHLDITQKQEKEWSPLVLYVFRLPANSILPQGIHITRDKKWTEHLPHGHHFNLTYGEFSGIEYVRKLSKIRFEEKWVLKCGHSVSVNDHGSWLCRRHIQSGVGTDPEGAIFEDWEYRNRFYGML